MKRVTSLPKTKEVPHTKKPDLDNLVKSVVDGLSGFIYADDKQIVEIHATKRYAKRQEEPGCWVHIDEVDLDLLVAKGGDDADVR